MSLSPINPMIIIEEFKALFPLKTPAAAPIDITRVTHLFPQLMHALDALEPTHPTDVAYDLLFLMLFRYGKHATASQVKQLLDRVKNPTATNSRGWTLLIAATEGDCKHSILSLLLRKGIPLDIATTSSGATALSSAAVKVRLDSVVLLLSHGANPAINGMEVETYTSDHDIMSVWNLAVALDHCIGHNESNLKEFLDKKCTALKSEALPTEWLYRRAEHTLERPVQRPDRETIVEIASIIERLEANSPAVEFDDILDKISPELSSMLVEQRTNLLQALIQHLRKRGETCPPTADWLPLALALLTPASAEPNLHVNQLLYQALESGASKYEIADLMALHPKLETAEDLEPLVKLAQQKHYSPETMALLALPRREAVAASATVPTSTIPAPSKPPKAGRRVSFKDTALAQVFTYNKESSKENEDDASLNVGAQSTIAASASDPKAALAPAPLNDESMNAYYFDELLNNLRHSKPDNERTTTLFPYAIQFLDKQDNIERSKNAYKLLRAMLNGAPSDVQTQQLLDRGADASYVDERGWTLLIVASRLSCTPEVLALLLKAGAPVNNKSRASQNTALHVIANKLASDTDLDNMCVLLSYGADPTAKDNNGKSPKDVLPNVNIQAKLCAEAALEAAAALDAHMQIHGQAGLQDFITDTTNRLKEFQPTEWLYLRAERSLKIAIARPNNNADMPATPLQAGSEAPPSPVLEQQESMPILQVPPTSNDIAPAPPMGAEDPRGPAASIPQEAAGPAASSNANEAVLGAGEEHAKANGGLEQSDMKPVNNRNDSLLVETDLKLGATSAPSLSVTAATTSATVTAAVDPMEAEAQQHPTSSIQEAGPIAPSDSNDAPRRPDANAWQDPDDGGFGDLMNIYFPKSDINPMPNEADSLLADSLLDDSSDLRLDDVPSASMPATPPQAGPPESSDQPEYMRIPEVQPTARDTATAPVPPMGAGDEQPANPVLPLGSAGAPSALSNGPEARIEAPSFLERVGEKIPDFVKAPFKKAQNASGLAKAGWYIGGICMALLAAIPVLFLVVPYTYFHTDVPPLPRPHYEDNGTDTGNNQDNTGSQTVLEQKHTSRVTNTTGDNDSDSVASQSSSPSKRRPGRSGDI